ncbi:MAG: hypothetical protein WAR80_09315, partial [Ferruginibacter sp.]
ISLWKQGLLCQVSKIVMPGFFKAKACNSNVAGFFYFHAESAEEHRTQRLLISCGLRFSVFSA